MSKRKNRPRTERALSSGASIESIPSPAAQSVSAANAPRSKKIVHLLLLAVISIAAYGPTLRNGFVTDDYAQILRNRNVKEPPSVSTIFDADVWSFAADKSAAEGVSNYYRPLQILVYAGEYAAFGDKPAGWHAVNVLLNVGVVLAVYFLVAMLGGPELALWSALLFALHPIHAEAVAWVAALPELLCGLLLVIATAFYHRARSGQNLSWYLALSTAAYLGALFTKETALLFPAILFSYEYFYRGQPLRKLWVSLRWIWPCLIALQIYLTARVLALGGFAPVYQVARAPMGPLELMLAIPAILARYVWKLFVPIHMNYFYAFPMPSTFGWWTIAGLAVTAILVVGMFAMRGHEPLLAFSLAWFLLTLAPAMSLNRIGENFFTERYLYIPSLGFCVVVAWCWLKLQRTVATAPAHGAVWAAGAALVIFYAAQLELRIPVFHDNFTLLGDTIRKSPESGEVQAEYAAALSERGDWPGALEHILRSLQLRPHHEISLLSAAQYFSEQRRYDEAIVRLQEAVALHPEYDVAWINLAKAFTEKRDWTHASEAYHRLQQIDPKRADYYGQLAALADANSRVGDAIAKRQEDATRMPHDPTALLRLSDVYAQASRWNDAAAVLQQAAQVAPRNVEIWTKLGICLEQIGDTGGAIEAFEHALAIDSDILIARKYLGEALAKAGRVDESTAQFRAILAKNPQYQHADEIHYELGLNLQKKGDASAAAGEFEQALRMNPGFVEAQKSLDALRSTTGKSNSR